MATLRNLASMRETETFRFTQTYTVVPWSEVSESDLDFSQAFVAPPGIHLTQGGTRTERLTRIRRSKALLMGLPPVHVDLSTARLSEQATVFVGSKVRRKPVTGLERILYEDARAGRYYLEVAVPKQDDSRRVSLVHKLLDTRITIKCPKCWESNWALLRHTVRTVYDGQREMACYRITFVCKNCDTRLAGIGVALDSAWERCQRSVANAFRRIRGISIGGGGSEVEGSIALDDADVRLRRC